MWQPIKKDTYLSVEDFIDIRNNFGEIFSVMDSLEYDLPEGFGMLIPSYTTLPNEILSYMNIVESKIQDFHKRLNNTIIGWSDNYYKKFLWKPITPNKQDEVFRWIDWLNDVYSALSNTSLTWEPLTDMNGETITDSNGETFYTAERRLN